MKTKTVRIGIAGCGRIADLQSLGYLNNPHAKIVAVCDSDPVRANQRAAQWGIPKVYTDFDAFLEDATIDAVEILTPHHLHLSHAVSAIKAGKHVSLQKPPARTIAEFDAIAAAAKKTSKIVRVFENFMYYPPHLKAKELIDQGAIGEPISVRVKSALGPDSQGWAVEKKSLSWRLDISKGGGGPITFDHGYHCFNMGRFFIPEDIERVHAFIHWTRKGKNSWYDGPALISWKYCGKIPRYGSWEVIETRQMRIRSKYYVSDDRIEIHGTEGVVWVNRCTGSLLDEPPVVLYREGETRAFHDLETDWADSFRIGGVDFVNAILKKSAIPQSMDEARKTLAFALAVARSAAQQREVAISEMLPSEEN